MNGNLAVKLKDKTHSSSTSTCVFGSTVLDCSALGITYYCKLRIKHIGTSLDVGVGWCQLIVSEKCGFRKGFDVICNDGQISSKSDSTVNGTYSQVLYGKGDIVEMIFRPSTMKLKISCNANEQTLNVKKPENGDHLRFLVFMCGTDSAVEITGEQ